jgi:hypothetical protein
MELAVREAYGPWQTRTTLPWQMEPTSNVVQSIAQKTTRWGSMESAIGGYIFLYRLHKQYISFAFELNELCRTFGRNLIDNALIHAFDAESRATTIPQQVSLSWRPTYKAKRPSLRRIALSKDVAAQSLLNTIRIRSGLTLEEIAPLLGVSRRSLQHWRAHGRISARKEQRLRDLADTLSSLPASEATEMRGKLLHRTSDGVRAYDLLAEGQFDSAYSMIAGSPAPAHLVARSIKPTTPSAPSMSNLLAEAINCDDPDRAWQDSSRPRSASSPTTW